MKTIQAYSRKNFIPLLSFAVIALILFGCAASTEITGTWKSPEATSQNYNRVIVAALTDNAQARQTVENDLQAQLQQRGIQVTKSIDVFPPAMMRERGSDADMLLQRIQGDGHDAILTVAVVDEETETRYVQGSGGVYGPYAPMGRFGWYGSFRGYYSHWYPTLYDPGYYTEDKVYFLESNLYDADSEQLLWSAQSRSYNPSSIDQFSEKFSELTVSRMQEENLIP
ncbi:hypothetical protein ACFSKU_09870 [Pontibacter silvestris]|uniref:DUF4136 domain-containing protein n=1 Tax=Pontibacter silvestris TaxID=2305183 RepID=A0ABW4WWY5_9BACT|nr:hypothetical protein [Pontibacter silvestris]MCC9136855.1 hypothetical protein [Pontibacter silvestris]